MFQLLAQSSYTYTYSSGDPGILSAIMGMFAVIMAIVAVIAIFSIVCMWKIFTKAGKPGWAAIVPVYNIIIMLEIIGKPWWWIFAIFAGAIPIVGPVVALAFSIILSIELANKFGKSTAFGVVGLWLFSLVGYAILAFGPAQYNPNAAPVTTFLTGNTPVGPQPNVNQYQQPAAPAQPMNEVPVQPVQPEVAQQPQPMEQSSAPTEPVEQPQVESNENQNSDQNF